MELFSEHGYEQTTVADIAKRAGVTERTFFRYFADKREVLFSGSEVLRDQMLAGLEAMPAATPPLDAVRAAIEALCANFTDRAFSARRHAIIDANPELREREIMKMSWYASELSDALRKRGVDDLAARIAAEMGISTFRMAWERWLAQPHDRPIAEFLREAFAQLKTLAAGVS